MNITPATIHKVRVNTSPVVHVGFFDRYANRVTSTLCNNAVFTTSGNYQVRRSFHAAGGPVTCGRCKKALAKRDA